MNLTTRTALILAQIVTIALAQDERGEETRRYDIRALSRALADTRASFPFPTPPNPPGGAGEASIKANASGAGEPESGSDGDLVRTLVTFAFEERIDPNGPNGQLRADDGKLHVTGNANFQQSVARLLGDLTRTVAPTVEVELSLLPPEALAATSSAVLDATMIERVLAIAKPLAVLRTRVRPGSEAMFEAVARRAYLKDYDSEVAQQAKAFDPLVDVMIEGTRVAVLVNALSSGGYHVTVRGQQAEADGPPRSQVISADGTGTLQLPRMFWAATSASGRVPARGALVIGSDASPKAAWAVRVLGPLAAATPGPESSTLQLVSIGPALGSPLLDLPPFLIAPTPSGATGMWAIFTEDAPAHRVDPDLMLEDLEALRPEGVAAPERRARLAGRYLALDGSPKFIAAATELATRIVDDVTRGISLEVRYGAVPAAGLTLPAPEEMTTLVEMLPHRAVTAATSGDRVIVIAGQSHSYLKDHDVEIAQNASIDDPIVEVFFTGLSMSCRPLLVGSDRCAAEVEFDYQEMLELGPVATGSQHVREIELPRIAAVRARVPVDGILGTWQLVHTAPIEGTDRQFILMVRAELY